MRFDDHININGIQFHLNDMIKIDEIGNDIKITLSDGTQYLFDEIVFYEQLSIKYLLESQRLAALRSGVIP